MLEIKKEGNIKYEILHFELENLRVDALLGHGRTFKPGSSIIFCSSIEFSICHREKLKFNSPIKLIQISF